MAELKIKNEEADALLVALGVDNLDGEYELKGGDLKLPGVSQSSADAAYAALDKKAIADKAKRAEKQRKLREKDLKDAETDDDITNDGLIRRIERLERITGLKP